MRRYLALGLLIPLVACGTPQEQCINTATKDLRVVEKLIAETQGNIDRGYAYRTETYFTTFKQSCGEVEGQTIYCDVPEPQTREVPLAIDLNAERAKLASLIQQRDRLEQQSAAAIQACRVTYPE